MCIFKHLPRFPPDIAILRDKIMRFSTFGIFFINQTWTLPTLSVTDSESRGSQPAKKNGRYVKKKKHA
jgi:hypothetical protein